MLLRAAVLALNSVIRTPQSLPTGRQAHLERPTFFTDHTSSRGKARNQARAVPAEDSQPFFSIKNPAKSRLGFALFRSPLLRKTPFFSEAVVPIQGFSIFLYGLSTMKN
jgi:hypothetical protein